MKRQEKTRKKCLIIGIDALVWPVVRELLRRGELPAIKHLLQEGCMTPLRSCLPVWTPTNWTSLSTGATSGRHGVIKWYTLTEDGKGRMSSFDSHAVKSERIWESFSRCGLKSLIIHYPAAWPCLTPNVAVIDGYAQPGLGGCPFEIAPPGIYILGERQDEETDNTMNLLNPIFVPPLASNRDGVREFILPLDSKEKEAWSAQRVILKPDGGVLRLLWCDPSNPENMVAETMPGVWTDWIRYEAEGKIGFTRFKALVPKKEGQIVIYRSQVVPDSGFGTAWACDKYSKMFGPFLEHTSTIPYRTGLVDFDTVLEDASYQADWMVCVSLEALSQKDADFAIFQWHFIDHLNHDHLHMIDPDSPVYDSAKANQNWNIFLKAYRIVDGMVEKALAKADSNTFIGVVSDHGCVSDLRAVNLNKFLWQRGFLSLKSGVNGLDVDCVREEDIDWKKTTAFGPDEKASGIRIHAQGDKRDKVSEAVLTALRSWIDPVTGKCPVEIALARKESHLFGLFGASAEDINIVWASGYSSGYFEKWKSILGGEEVGDPEVFSCHHAGMGPLASTTMTSNLATLILAGPGLKKNYVRDVERIGIPPITSVAPTLCTLLEAEHPRHCEADTLWDFFEGVSVERNALDEIQEESYLVAKRLEHLGYL